MEHFALLGFLEAATRLCGRILRSPQTPQSGDTPSSPSPLVAFWIFFFADEMRPWCLRWGQKCPRNKAEVK